MTSWADLAAAEPDFADRVRRTFGVRQHATMATLRRDGSPRISGTEVRFDDVAGELLLESMPGARKAADLRRDPRVAVHCPTVDPPEEDPGAWPGDGKITGLAVDLGGSAAGPDGADRFRVDLVEVVLTRVGDPADHLVIESWHPGRGLERRERR